MKEQSKNKGPGLVTGQESKFQFLLEILGGAGGNCSFPLFILIKAGSCLIPLDVPSCPAHAEPRQTPHWRMEQLPKGQSQTDICSGPSCLHPKTFL